MMYGWEHSRRIYKTLQGSLNNMWPISKQRICMHAAQSESAMKMMHLSQKCSCIAKAPVIPVLNMWSCLSMLSNLHLCRKVAGKDTIWHFPGQTCLPLRFSVVCSCRQHCHLTETWPPSTVKTSHTSVLGYAQSTSVLAHSKHTHFSRRRGRS